MLFITIYLFSSLQVIASPNWIAPQDLPRDHRQTVNSPNVWAFTQYLEHPVDFYTGLPVIEIPLYEIKTGSLSFPITLSYHASGIRVEQMASNVGLGWQISSNNAISRIVRGFPDDLDEKEYRNHNGNIQISDNAGYLYGGYNHDMEEIASGMYDAIPDMFLFSCGKYKGKFFLSEDGAPQLVPQQDVSIQMTRSNGNTGVITGFKVVTPEGTIYDYKEIEECYQASASFLEHGISADHWSLSNFHGPFYGCISGPNYAATLAYYKPIDKQYNSSWFLSTITSINGDVIRFDYEEEHQLIRNYGGANNDKIQSHGSTDDPVDHFYGYFRTAYSLYFITQRLSKISFNNAEINFEYKIREDTEYGEDYHPHYNYALKKIEVKNAYSNEVLKNIELVTSYFISPDPNISGHTEQTQNNSYPALDAVLSKRLKLEQVLVKNESDEIPYTFDYYEDDTFPSRISDEMDLWGFYNNNNKAGIVPEFYEYPDDPYGNDQYYTSPYSLFKRENYEGDEIYYPGANRMSNPNTITSLSLKSIHYPTGGLTNYEYEMHDFYIKGEKKQGGGIRISKITKSIDSILGNNDDMVYMYDYHESGKIVRELFIKEQKSVYEKFPEVGHARYSEPEGGISSSKSSFVTYSRVSEILGDAETEFVYDHSAMLGTTYHEYLTDNQEYIFIRPRTEGYGEEKYLNVNNAEDKDNGPLMAKWHKCPYYPNYDWKRTLLKEVNYYKNISSSKIPVKKINNSYLIKNYTKIPFKWTSLERKKGNYKFPGTTIPAKFIWTIHYAYSEGYFLSAWIVLSEVTETEYYTDGSSISKTVDYEYESSLHKQLTSETFENSNGDVFKTKYRYAPDFQSDIMCNSMRYINDLEPVEIIKYKNDQVTNSTITQFTCIDCNFNDNYFYGGPIKPSKVYSLELEQPVTDYQLTSSTYSLDSRHKQQVSYDSYDNLGNPLQITDKTTGITTCYIWGYEREYPIAKVVNATYSEIESILGSTDLEFLNAGYTFDYDEFNDVKYIEDIYSDEKTRNLLTPLRASLPNAQVTTYTYKPLVGMTSETDPNGITTYYEYDNFNRLKTIKDYEGNIVSQYDYHHKNQKP